MNKIWHITCAILFGSVTASHAETQVHNLVIKNDSKESVLMYTDKSFKKEESVSPGQQWSKARGKVYIYVPSKNGTYEVTYTFPRTKGQLRKVTLMQLMNASKQKSKMDEHDYYTEHGTIGDISIFFETIPLFAD